MTKVSNKKGAMAETRAVRILTALASVKNPEWLLDARKAPPWLDARGVDVIATTDVGDLYLQIKSSRRGAKTFRRAKKHTPLPEVVVVGSGHSDADVGRRLVAALQKVRQEVGA